MHRRKIRISSIHDSDCQRIKKTKQQNSSKTKKKGNSPNKCIPWKFLKTVVFVMCLIFFFYQSMIFLNDYYTYPTTTRFAVKNPKQFRMPCITFCNTNPIKRSKFCSVFPHLCEAPSNVTEFCLKYPHMCTRNKSIQVIPKSDRPSSKAMQEMGKALRNLYENRDMSQETWSTWSWDIPTSRTKTKSLGMTASLVRGIYKIGYPTCYSANLRFSGSLPARSWAITEEQTEFMPEDFLLYVEKEESFDPSKIPQIVFAVHSPYIPIHPIDEGKALEIGHTYLIGIKLEEEHLSPYPYQTDCIDYDALWRMNNKTGPRSQEACKQGCFWNNSTECSEFHPKAKMILFTENMCKLNFQNKLDRKECIKHCKADCEKLKYGYKISDFPLDEGSDFEGDKSRTIIVSFYIDNPQVIDMSHIPLYNVGDLFSYIGGLMGCWLGVSVATLTGIVETSFTEGKHMASRLRRYIRCCFEPPHSYNSHQRKNFISMY